MQAVENLADMFWSDKLGSEDAQGETRGDRRWRGGELAKITTMKKTTTLTGPALSPARPPAGSVWHGQKKLFFCVLVPHSSHAN